MNKYVEEANRLGCTVIALDGLDTAVSRCDEGIRIAVIRNGRHEGVIYMDHKILEMIDKVRNANAG